MKDFREEYPDQPLVCESYRKNSSISHMGKTRTQESREKQGESIKARWERGDFDHINVHEVHRLAKERILETLPGITNELLVSIKPAFVEESKVLYDSRVLCALCGKEYRQISFDHLVFKHGILMEDYRLLFPDSQLACKETCKKRSDYSMEAYTRGDRDGFVYSEQYKSKLEEGFAVLLDEWGIPNTRQFRLTSLPHPYNRHPFDFRIVGTNVLVEVDGCHCHGCLSCYPGARKYESVQRRVNKDRDLNRCTSQQGWKLIRFWEHEVNCWDDIMRSDVQGLLKSFID